MECAVCHRTGRYVFEYRQYGQGYVCCDGGAGASIYHMLAAVGETVLFPEGGLITSHPIIEAGV